MNEIVSLFKEKDIRITPQRLGVYKVLFGQNKHLTAEEIYEKIKNTMPALSLATVYTVLDLFKEKDIVNEIRIEFDKSHFETKVEFHHHFLCRKCKKIFDIEKPPCQELERMKVNGHSIEKLQGYFYGVCKDCINEDG